VKKPWTGLNVTVEEGLAQLTTLCSMEVKAEGSVGCLRIPVPRKESSALLKAAFGAGAGSAASPGDLCSHAPLTAIRAKSTYLTNGLGLVRARPQG